MEQREVRTESAMFDTERSRRSRLEQNALRKRRKGRKRRGREGEKKKDKINQSWFATHMSSLI